MWKSVERSAAPRVECVPVVKLPGMEEFCQGDTVFRTYCGGTERLNSLSVYQQGGVAEAANKAVATLYARMMSAGSLRYDAATIADAVDFCGSWNSNGAYSHYVSNSLFSINSRFAEVLPYFADYVNNPTVPEEMLEIEKRKIISALELNAKSVSWNADECASRMMMGDNHPLLRNITVECVKAVTTRDLLAFNRQWNRYGGRYVYMAGQIGEKEIDLVRDALGGIDDREVNNELNIVPFCPVQAGKEECVEVESAVQNAVTLTLPAIGREHPDYVDLHIAVMALGGYFGSRLNRNIREEKGLTYGIGASLVGQREGGYVSVSAQCAPQSTRLLIDEVRKELDALRTNPPEGEELMRLCQSGVGALFESVSTPLAIAGFHALELTVGCPRNYFDHKCESLRNLTGDRIAAMAEKYLKSDLIRVAIAGEKV